MKFMVDKETEECMEYSFLSSPSSNPVPLCWIILFAYSYFSLLNNKQK